MPAISLQEIMARGTSIHWDEAVAIVEELCTVLVAEGGDDARVPGLGDVFIGSLGDVTLGSTRGDRGPTAAGRLLHTLLTNAADVPMPLRLFVTQATTSGTHETLGEFVKGLAYFAKPNRGKLIRDIHTRCSALPEFAVDEPAASPPPAETEMQAFTGELSQRRRQRVPRWAIAAAALTLAVVGASVWMSRGGSALANAATSQMFSNAAAKLADLGQQVRNTFAEPTAASQPAVETSAASSPAPPARATAAAAPKAPLLSRPMIARQRERWKLTTAAPQFAAVPAPPVSDVHADAAAVVAQDGTVYSVADRDVEPPVLLYPHVKPAPAEANAQSGTVNRMAVIVSTDGTVERVQLVDGPTRMPDMMLLSGAKTWKFAPATKDGEPVRYRTVISWSGRP